MSDYHSLVQHGYAQSLGGGEIPYSREPSKPLPTKRGFAQTGRGQRILAMAAERLGVTVEELNGKAAR